MPNKTTDAFDARAYMNQYVKEKIIYKRVNFTRGKAEDEELLTWLDAQSEGIAPYISRLIRADMESRLAPEKP